MEKARGKIPDANHLGRRMRIGAGRICQGENSLLALVEIRHRKRLRSNECSRIDRDQTWDGAFLAHQTRVLWFPRDGLSVLKPLAFTLGRTPEPILEQIMRMQLPGYASPLASCVALDLGHGDLGIVA